MGNKTSSVKRFCAISAALTMAIGSQILTGCTPSNQKDAETVTSSSSRNSAGDKPVSASTETSTEEQSFISLELPPDMQEVRDFLRSHYPAPSAEDWDSGAADRDFIVRDFVAYLPQHYVDVYVLISPFEDADRQRSQKLAEEIAAVIASSDNPNVRKIDTVKLSSLSHDENFYPVMDGYLVEVPVRR